MTPYVSSALMLLACLLYASTEPLAGPFRIIPDRIEKCPDALLDVPFEATVKTMRDRHKPDVWYYSVNYTTTEVFDDNLDMFIHMSSWSSRGGWKENGLIFKVRKACSSIKSYLPKLWRTIRVQLHGDCPFPKGSYSLTNLSSTDAIAVQMPALYYGKWRADLKSIKTFPSGNTICSLCLRFFLQIVPKLSGT